ncbi:acyl-CoA dehydrogenase family protein [uncultured Jatrophihabitans sp.]|uniref:acyl-CoA dehydrogenase family protein n=1 Tax=uncultured Jatrophihabitans sp. TaxID=1610747 RepID=UPI0035CA7A7A
MRLPSDDEVALRDACRDVLARHTTSARLRLTSESETGFDPDFWKLAAELGWTALAVPGAAGGLDGTVSMLAVVGVELGRALQPGPLLQTLAASHVIGRHGEPGAVQDLLDAVVAGQAVLTWGGFEPDSPSTVDQRGGTLHGHVELVPDAPSSTHLLLPFVRDVDSSPSLALVELAACRVTATPTMDLTRRYATVSVDGVAYRDLGLPAGAGRRLFDVGVVLQCAESTGVARRLLDMTVTYSGQREQFGRAIGSFQALKHRMADMLVETEGCRVATREAADALDGSEAGGRSVGVASSWVGRAASFVATHALQIHGGVGFSWEHDLHLFLRRAKTNELLLGSPGWHDERLYRSLLPSGVPGAS